MKSVQTISSAKFKITTPGIAGSELELDFNPIINEFNLTGAYFLIHWQARPKGHREWGIYSSLDNTYRSVAEVKLNSDSLSLQLDDLTASTVPSAVWYVNGDSATCINEKIIVGRVYLSDVA